jgi:hypothetical protein
MKKTARTIDRATALKAGGTAALSLLLTQALEARARACCGPIDLRYVSSELALMSETASIRSYRTRPKAPRGIRLRSPRPGESSPPKLTGWTPLFFIPDASALGVDEDGVPHGLDGSKSVPEPLHYGIWLYTK